MYKEIGFIEGMTCQCVQCGFRWVQMGRLHQSINFKRELSDLWESYKVYVSHGVVVWPIASIVHFLVSVQDPWIAVVSLKSGWWILGLAIFCIGIAIGFALSNAILFSGRYWPETPAVHIVLPLLCAAFVGAMQGLLWGYTNFVFFTAGIILRSESIRMISGALLGMCVTPIIIVRSSNILGKKGLRPKLKPPEDDRWQS